jgi:hypothetical protein
MLMLASQRAVASHDHDHYNPNSDWIFWNTEVALQGQIFSESGSINLLVPRSGRNFFTR